MKPEFHYAIFIVRPAREVWEALTQKAIVDRYFMAPLFEIDLRPGGPISYGADTEVILGTITEVAEPTRLVHTFRFDGSPDEESIVTYDIEAIGPAMCALRISHTGFRRETETYRNICHGWPVIASSLKTLLETGREMPWPKG